MSAARCCFQEASRAQSHPQVWMSATARMLNEVSKMDRPQWEQAVEIWVAGNPRVHAEKTDPTCIAE